MKTIKSLQTLSVLYAKRILNKKQQIRYVVVKNVKKWIQILNVKLESMLRSAVLVEKNLQDIAIKQNTAQESVCLLDVEKLKAVDREYIGNHTVYNLATDTHNYIANGFVVHNCDGMTQLMDINIFKPSEALLEEVKPKNKFDMIFSDENFSPKEDTESSYVV